MYDNWLGSQPKPAVGAHVMLHYNGDIKVGFVKSAIGTVHALNTTSVTIHFDHVSISRMMWRGSRAS